jgi:invasion protein IalB
MFKFLTVLPFCAAFVVAAPTAAFAQTSTEEPATSAPSVADGLSLGEDADVPVGVGQPYAREVNGAWELRCLKVAEGEEPCQMYQMMDDGQGAPVAEISMFRLEPGGRAVAGANIIVPLETALSEQLTLAIDGGPARRYPFAFCGPVGCFVRVGLTEADVTAFKRGSMAKLTIVPALAPDQQVTLDMSLEGFTATFDEVTILDQ